MDSLASLPPGLLLVLGALLLPALPRAARSGWLLLLPLISLGHALSLPIGTLSTLHLFDLTLTPVRVDALSNVFGLLFHVAAFACALFAAHDDDDIQHVSGLIYAGAAIMAVYAGDLASLFVAWELTAISSVFLIFAARTEHSLRVGLRYLLIQVGSGVILLDGVLDHVAVGGSLEFTKAALLGVSEGAVGLDFWEFHTGVKFIFLAFAIKAAFPLVHSWLQDAYPSSTATGTVFLGIFTTKMAIYAFVRAFPGTDQLITLGAVMATVPLFYAFVENDLRKVMAYVLNNQLGMMVVGVGVGSALALNGVVAHAVAHVLYEGLIFMALGALLYKVGTTRASELGRLYRQMPQTAALCVIGGLALAGMPGLAGFTTKAMTLSAVAASGRTFIWLLMAFASVGVIAVAAVRLPFAAFYADRDPNPELPLEGGEAPLNMRLAMGLMVVALAVIGIAPIALYGLLPFKMDQPYIPYTVEHVIQQLQVVAFAVLAFTVMNRRGLLVRSKRQLLLDSDWLYRSLAPQAVRQVVLTLAFAKEAVMGFIERRIGRAIDRLYAIHGPESAMARTWPTGATAMWAAALLGVYLVVYYL